MNLNRTVNRIPTAFVAALMVAAFSAIARAQGEPGVQYSDPNGFFTVTLPASWGVRPYPAQSFKSFALNAGTADGSMGMSVWIFPGVQSGEAAIGQLRGWVASNRGRMNWHEQAPVNSGGRQYRQFFGDTAYDQGGAWDWINFVRSFQGGTVIVTIAAPKGRLIAVMPQLRQVFNTFDPGG